jgi:hypothetical protein
MIGCGKDVIPPYKGARGIKKLNIEKSTKKEPKKRLSLIRTAFFFTVYVSPLLYQSPQKTSLEVQESLQLTVDR